MGSGSTFTVRFESRNDVGRVVVVGELDTSSAPVLEGELTRIGGDDLGAIIFDLRAVSFMDAGGLHAILRAYRRAKANGQRMIVVGATQPVRRLLDLTGTSMLLEELQAISVLERFTGRSLATAGAMMAEVDLRA
jgi:anti-anti-sigma factor